MSRQIEPSTTCPYWLGMIALFTICLTAPRSWELVARNEPINPGELVKAAPADAANETVPVAKQTAVAQSTHTPASGSRKGPAKASRPHVAASRTTGERHVARSAPAAETKVAARPFTTRVASSSWLALPSPKTAPSPTSTTAVAAEKSQPSDDAETSVTDTPSLDLPLLAGPANTAADETTVESTDNAPAVTEVADADGAPLPDLSVPQPATPQVAADDAPSQVQPEDDREVPPRDAPVEDTSIVALEEAPTVYTWLDSLAWDCHTSQWAGRALELLGQFDESLSAGKVGAVVESMRQLGSEADRLADSTDNEQLATDIRRARYALVRATDAWRLAVAMQSGTSEWAQQDEPAAKLGDGRSLVTQLEVLTDDSNDEVTEAWREYLMLDALASVAATQPSARLDGYRDVVEQTVHRLDGAGLTGRQRAYLSQQRFAALSTELKALVAEPVDPHAFLARIDHYERTRLPSQARLVARDLRNLEVARGETVKQLGKRMEAHYRNANLRIAISADLIERLLPELPATDAPVRERIMNADVRGWQHTETDLSVRFVPDARRLRMLLEADGSVTASTRAYSGPATVRNSSVADFHVEKPVVHAGDRISSEPASVSVGTHVCLRDVDTDLDVIPIIGGFTRLLVEQKALDGQGTARSIMRRQVTDEVSRRVDEVADEKLAAVNDAIQQRFFVPMRGLGLAPKIIETRTDERRMTLRMRLASDQQLGSHTPRPRAPSDSLLSIQVHDSALNNLIEQFNLEGGTFTPAELKALIAEKMNHSLDEGEEATGSSQDVRITFASEDPVRIRCEDGLVHVRLAFDRFERGNKVWNGIVARANYRPHVDGFKVRLERDGATDITGEMSARQRIGLRAIFAKILPRERELANVMPEQVDPSEITDLEITQLVLADGWIGIAVGPRRDDLAARTTPDVR